MDGELVYGLIAGVFALSGVALTLATNGAQERRRWRQSRTSGRQDASRRALTDLLQTTTQVIAEIRRTVEQIQVTGKPDRAERLQTIDDLITAVRRQATAAYIGCSKAAFALINNLEREMVPLHVHLDASLASGQIEELLTDADMLITCRNRLINELRKEDDLPLLEDTPVSPRRTRRTNQA